MADHHLTLPALVLAALVNDLADDCASERPSSDLVLVFDDYHSVDSAAVDRAVAFLVDHLPAEVHLVIIGREDPALPIARLRASGQLAELRAHELRFTAEETRRFVNGFTGLQLSDQDVDTLRQATEGWVAGLQLAALSVDGDPHPGARIRAFSSSNRFVIDYLVEEVLARLPGELVRFLVRTSVLDRMCGPLCDAVLDGTETGSVPTGQERLEYLDRANLFVVPLDDERHWYRYHHLFRDLLRQRLGQAETREAIDALHCRAGEWLATELGQPVPAVPLPTGYRLVGVSRVQADGNPTGAAIYESGERGGGRVVLFVRPAESSPAEVDIRAATKDFQGLTGNLTCSPTGDCADPKIAVYEVTDTTAWNPNVTSPMKVYPK